MRARALLALTLIGALVPGCAGPKTPVSSPRTTDPARPTSEQDIEEPGAITMDRARFDSVSLRNPNDGALRGGVPLPMSAPGLRFNPRRDPKTRFGTLEVVQALLGAANRVRRELGGLPVTINALSYAKGGPIPHHRSHQSGRDVDVLFYELGPDGKPIESVGAFFDPSGSGVDFKDLADRSDDLALRLDIPRTWLFAQALIEDEKAQLQQIFVAEHLRTLLLDYARAQAVAAHAVERFAEMSCQPSYPHDDHFHFRFFCAPEDIALGCRDSSPMYPWHRRRLEAHGQAPLPLAPRREQSKAKIVTPEEAREDAGPLDAEVERWLDRRKAWIKKPHPGRTYCP